VVEAVACSYACRLYARTCQGLEEEDVLIP
jgi:hypothetical protein